MQSVSSRIWTRVAVSISYDDKHYTTVNILVSVNSPSQLFQPYSVIYFYYYYWNWFEITRLLTATKDTYRRALGTTVWAYEGGLKSSLAEKFKIWRHITDDFLINKIQTLQLLWRKYVDRKLVYVEKKNSLDHIPCEYFGQLMNFSTDSLMSIFMNLSTNVIWKAKMITWYLLSLTVLTNGTKIM